MAKKDKVRRPRAETPKGFRDYFGAEVTQRKAMLDAIAGVYHLYGFEALESSAVETVDALGSFQCIGNPQWLRRTRSVSTARSRMNSP